MEGKLWIFKWKDYSKSNQPLSFKGIIIETYDQFIIFKLSGSFISQLGMEYLELEEELPSQKIINHLEGSSIKNNEFYLITRKNLIIRDFKSFEIKDHKSDIEHWITSIISFGEKQALDDILEWFNFLPKEQIYFFVFRSYESEDTLKIILKTITEFRCAFSYFSETWVLFSKDENWENKSLDDQIFTVHNKSKHFSGKMNFDQLMTSILK